MVILNQENCGSFRDIDIYPSQEEILGKCTPIQKNIICGRFHNVTQYLDIQFKLLREDFIANLREGIESYRSNEKTRIIDIYENVRISKIIHRNEECFAINMNTHEDDKKFMNGSLLLFTRTRFTDMYRAKVVQKVAQSHDIIIELIDDCTTGYSYTMVECGQYFDPYYNVLKALQNIPTYNFPMERYIVHVDTRPNAPRYLQQNSRYFIEDIGFTPPLLLDYPKPLLNLNPSQMKAFTAALTREFVVIQGPPGCGKTHLGVKIVSTIVQNLHLWYKNTPMLVISHKNDALDQFLEGLIPVTDQLVRVGAHSKSEKLKEFNLATTNESGVVRRRHREEFFSVMQKSLVLGMTTSMASRWKDYLERLMCPIVIVEEAAEVLEAHVVAALTDKCQHLILLGDHQQLQPLTADNNIGKRYHLGISLFERMVRNGIQCYQLDVQHRMRPEISDLLKIKIYPFLKDHESVYNRPPILGVQKNLFFIDHNYQEETCNVTTKKNPYEAIFVVKLAQYLIFNNYQPEKIVILASYLAQMQEIESLAKKTEVLENVKISTLDGFQGQEAEIVLLSLVRSEGIGFLKAANRICVALSRARNGFFIMGNMNLLASKSEVWLGVKQSLQKQGSLGEKLTLICQNHKTVTQIGNLDDFNNVKFGGCNLKCSTDLKCQQHGLGCILLCHTSFMKHKCKEGCTKFDELKLRDDLWRRPRTDRYVIPTSRYENNQRINLREAEPQQNVLFTILGFLGNMIRSVVRFIVERFFT